LRKEILGKYVFFIVWSCRKEKKLRKHFVSGERLKADTLGGWGKGNSEKGVM